MLARQLGLATKIGMFDSLPATGLIQSHIVSISKSGWMKVYQDLHAQIVSSQFLIQSGAPCSQPSKEPQTMYKYL